MLKRWMGDTRAPEYNEYSLTQYHRSKVEVISKDNVAIMVSVNRERKERTNKGYLFGEQKTGRTQPIRQ
jgi:L,D-peptidoglycan transpeptidase YkuD (ErfK/YbiS/YcfS/YnhG family)